VGSNPTSSIDSSIRCHTITESLILPKQHQTNVPKTK
jgi:hypothetical protein